MLESLGDTPNFADRRWWSLSRLPNEDIGALYLRIRSTGLRRLDCLKTREEVVEHTILSRFMSLLPQDCYAAVSDRHPKDGKTAARMAQEWEDTRRFSRCQRPWRTGQRPYNSFRGSEGELQGGYNGSNPGSHVTGGPSSSGVVSSPSSNSGSKVSSTQENNGKQASGGAGRYERGNQRERKPIICFGCGEAGHIKPKYPNKVRRVSPQEGSAEMLIDGSLAGYVAKGLQIDTGADRTVVRKDFVPLTTYTGKEIRLYSWRGEQPSQHKLARIQINVGPAKASCVVAVVDNLDCPALLGVDLGKVFMTSVLTQCLAQTLVCLLR